MNTPNTYPGTCAACGHHVDADAGVRDLDEDGSWIVYHHDGDCGDPDDLPREGEMPNRWAGTCVACGTTVAAREGITYLLNGRWLVQHTDC